MEFPIQATITHSLELNGNQSVSFTILPTKVNKSFIDDIAEMWEFIDTNEVVHKIIYAKKKGEGTLLNVDIQAVPLFFDTMDNERIYEEYNEHMTAMSAFTKIFEGMPFGFVLSDVFEAVEWEGFGAGESRLETFKRALERYKAEFRIVGNTVYLERQIGRDTSFMYRHKLNASNIVKEIDANEYWTYAKGYGNYGNEGEGDGESSDWQDAKLIREYTSPLAKILGIRHAPPIKDGRISIASRMDSGLKALVDDSLKISITTDIHDLRRQGYALAQPELGDRVFVIDERIGLDQEVRVIDVSLTKDWRGNVLDLKLTIGSESLTKRHQSNMSTAVDRINELVEGRRKLPFSVLDDAVRNATKALQNAQTELSFGTNGILAVDKSNPNLLTLLNSAGIGISNDGGNTFRTAMTGDGIVADVITAGVLNADQVSIRGGDGTSYSYIQGSLIESSGRYTRSWRGKTETNDVRLLFENGYMRARNDSKNQSLYFSDFGISTYNDAVGSGAPSGSVLFRDLEYSTAGGVTVNSGAGVVALSSDSNRVVVDAYSTVNIDSDTASIYLRPMKTNRLGLNEFTFRVKNNDSVSTTDGWISYGNVSDGETHGSGIRFSKSLNNPIVHMTNVNGDFSSAKAQAISFIGDIEAPYDNAQALVNEEFRVRNKGNTANRDLQARHARFNSIRVNDSGGNLYLGTSSGEVRVTTNSLAEGGITFRGIRASQFFIESGGRLSNDDGVTYVQGNSEVRATRYMSGTLVPMIAREFNTSSSEELKTNIHSYEGKGLDIICDLNIVNFDWIESPEAGRQIGVIAENSPDISASNGKVIKINDLVMYLTKSVQELREELEKIKEVN